VSRFSHPTARGHDLSPLQELLTWRDNRGRPGRRALLNEARLMVDQHDRLVATITAPAAAAPGLLRAGVSLELPAGPLPGAIAEVAAAHPDVRVHLQHAASSAQFAMVKAGDLEVALVRDRPAGLFLDSVLAVEEATGVVLTAARSAEISEPAGVPLDRLAGMTWAKFARSARGTDVRLRLPRLGAPAAPRPGLAPAGREPDRRANLGRVAGGLSSA
jgi:hypothetical protein